MATCTSSQNELPPTNDSTIDELIDNLINECTQFSNDAVSIIDYIDEGMGRYYNNQNTNYYPTDKTQPGIFKSWCQDQGYSDLEIVKFLSLSGKDCRLTDFCNDDNDLIDFPFEEKKDEALDNNHKQIKIYKILKSFYNPIHFDKELFYCWITENIIKNQDNKETAIINPQQFIFSFYLWILHKNKYYRYSFEASYKQIKLIYNSKNSHHFADNPFPRISSNTKKWRNELLKQQLLQRQTKCNQTTTNQQKTIDPYVLSLQKIKYQQKRMKYMEQNMLYNADDIGTGPKAGWFSSRSADINDLKLATSTLCKIFNTPTIILNEPVFDIFQDQFIDEMQQLLRKLATNFINDLQTKSKTQNNKKILWKLKNQHRKLYNDPEYIKMKFHRVSVVRKPYNSFHWSLKFEGIDKLLSLDWFNNSRIRYQILDNNAIGQRIYWYGRLTAVDQLTYTKQWNVVYSENIETLITGKQIGEYVEVWFNLYNKYHPLTNSCQHFVRDIMAAINIKAGELLIKELQRPKISRIFFPDNASKEEQIRTIYVNDKLNTLFPLCEYLYRIQILDNEYDHPDDKNTTNKRKVKYFDLLKEVNIQSLHNVDEAKEILTSLPIQLGHRNAFLSRIDEFNL